LRSPIFAGASLDKAGASHPLPFETGRDYLVRLRAIAIKGDLPGLCQALREEIALAFVLRQPDAIAILKASTEAHARDNVCSLKMKLTKEDLTDLDREFPPPKAKRPLPVL
jgi:aryl-alcohol dehydrogenase-like predicted oxidoreductase